MQMLRISRIYCSVTDCRLLQAQPRSNMHDEMSQSTDTFATALLQQQQQQIIAVTDLPDMM